MLGLAVCFWFVVISNSDFAEFFSALIQFCGVWVFGFGFFFPQI